MNLDFKQKRTDAGGKPRVPQPQPSEGPIQKRKLTYIWTKEKDDLIIQLWKEGKTRKQIAESLNEDFREGPRADKMTVANRLTRKIYKDNSDLKRQEMYEWTEEKDDHAIQLLKEGKTSKQIVGSLNERFREGQRADESTLAHRLKTKIYRGNSDLKRQYEWTGEKDDLVIQLWKEGKTRKQIAESLNEDFREGPRADEQTVAVRLRTTIHRENSDLKRQYEWTGEKDDLVIQLLKKGKNYKQIAASLNQLFREGPRADKMTVANRLTRKIYKDNSDLKRQEMYEWTEEKNNLVIQLLKEGKTRKQIAESLNDRFRNGPRADEMTVGYWLETKIYRENCDLRRREEAYKWTKERDDLVIQLLKKGKTNKQIAESLNEKFREGPRADETTVTHRLKTKIYKENSNLKRREAYEWTKEKDDFVIQLLKKGETRKQIAELLNKKFQGGPRANEQTVASRLNNKIYKENNFLKRLEMYEWTNEKDHHVTQLLMDGKTYKQIAESLNEKFQDGLRADKQTVAHRLTCKIYKEFPSLRRMPSLSGGYITNDLFNQTVLDAMQQFITEARDGGADGTSGKG